VCRRRQRNQRHPAITRGTHGNTCADSPPPPFFAPIEKVREKMAKNSSIIFVVFPM